MFYLWREARLRDPDGHDVRLYFAGENRLDPPWKVTSEPPPEPSEMAHGGPER